MSPRTTLRLAVPVLASGALLLAGCGNSASTAGVAHLSKEKSTGANASGASSPESRASVQQKMVAYAQCMRSHGVAEFPEPTEGKLLLRSSDKNGRVTGIDPQSAQFQTAQKACAKLMPEGGRPSAAQSAKAQEGALKFSACMRSHGVPNFPDPTFSGGGIRMTLKAGGANGVDPNSPQFQAAQKACQSDLPKPPGSDTAEAAPVAGASIGTGGATGGE
jgi:hypothetical protein